jgi:hypothetical protein
LSEVRNCMRLSCLSSHGPLFAASCECLRAAVEPRSRAWMSLTVSDACLDGCLRETVNKVIDHWLQLEREDKLAGVRA